MSNIPGFILENLFLVLLSYVLILLVNRKTSSESALLLLSVLTFHHIVAYLYAFYLDRPPNELDPDSFVWRAKDCLEFGYCGYFGQHLYANYLAKIFGLGQSLYFVFLLNILFFVVSLYYFIGISKVLSLKGNRKIYIFLYSMWPSVVFYTTLNYREPFELYLLIAGIFYGLTGSKSDSFLRMLASMILLLLMGMFHIKGLIFLAPILFLVLVSYRLPMTVTSLVKKISLLLVMCIAAYFSQSMYIGDPRRAPDSNLDARIDIQLAKITESIKSVESEAVTFIKENKSQVVEKSKIKPATEINIFDNLMKKVTAYRKHIVKDGEPRSSFSANISDESISEFISSYVQVYLEYLFSPFIFQVNSFHNLIAYAESVLRLILLVSALILLKRYPQTSILFIIYLAITSMWAIGVVSFGAAIRHHVQTNWILILLGVPIIAEYLGNKFRITSDKMEINNR